MAGLLKEVRNTNTLAQAGAGIANERQGSLASACQELNEQIDLLEQAAKRTYEKVHPFLEAQPDGSGQTESQPQAGSPLAQAILEYALRVRTVRAALEDISKRVAY